MQTYELVLPEDTYLKHLEDVNNIRFTRREIDTIAYLLSGRSAKTISSLLSIAPKTIETHVRNIMQKLECNSRDNIIDFIEKSDKLCLIKKHYANLLTQAAFEKQLLKISELLGSEGPTCRITYWKEQDYKTTLIHCLEEHLQHAGVKATLEMREGNNFTVDSFNEIKSSQTNYVLYPLPDRLLGYTQDGAPTKKSEFSHFMQRIGETSNCIIMLFSNNTICKSIHEELGNINYINFSEQKNYYFFALTVLKKILPTLDFDEIISDFKRQYESLQGTSQNIYLQIPQGTKFLEPNVALNKYILFVIKILNLTKKRYVFISGVFCLSVLCFWFFTSFDNRRERAAENKEEQKEIFVRSDLIVPTESILLDRPQLMHQIEKHLKGDGIQTIALVGIGGAGKTTIARHYARQQNTPMVWEVNAETQENLMGSFENLARLLAKTEDEKKKLRELKDSKDVQEREKGIILFVREGLKSLSSWFLIYDNVEKFTDIQRYFPHDSRTWGMGKIIITSRDYNRPPAEV